MKRGWAIRRAGFWDPVAAVDLVVLDAGDRHRRRIVLKGEQGTEFLLDLDEAVALCDGDGIMLDDGGIVLVTGQPEPLGRDRGADTARLVQLAWHLGNRHTDVQIAGDRCESAAITCWRRWCRAWAAESPRSMHAFDPEPGAPHDHHEHAHDD